MRARTTRAAILSLLENCLDEAVIIAGRNGRIRFCTHLAAEMLNRCCGLGVGHDLSVVGADWSSFAQYPWLPVVLEGTGGKLTVRLYDRRAPGEVLMLRLEEEINIAGPQLLQQLGLTQREGEVLFWSTQGKTTPQIAIILGCAPNTVKKHLFNIFQKLAVETRTEAALLALQVLGVPALGALEKG